MLFPKIVAGLLFALWLALVLLGKGGLNHILLLGSIDIAVVETMVFYRTRMLR